MAPKIASALVSIAVPLLFAGSAPGQFAALQPGDLQVHAAIVDATGADPSSDATFAPLTLTLTNQSSHPIHGWAQVGPLAAPPQSPTEAARPLREFGEERSFSIKAGRQTTLQVTVPFPGAAGGHRFELPIVLHAGHGKRPTVGEEFDGFPEFQRQELLLSRTPDWWVAGPFSNRKRSGFATAYEPESKPRGKSFDAGEFGTVAFEPLRPEALTQDGMVDFAAHHDGPDDDLAYYARIAVDCTGKREAVLHLGSDDTLTVWHNGKRIHENETYRTATRSADQVPVTLTAGRNEFMLKVCNGDGGFGMFFEIKDSSDRPASGVELPSAVRLATRRDPELRVVSTGQRSARLRWRTAEAQASAVTLQQIEAGRADPTAGLEDRFAVLVPVPGSPAIVAADPELATTHEVDVAGLPPGTRFRATLEDSMGSHSISFFTEAADGHKLVLKLRLAVVIFTNVTERSDASEDSPPTGPNRPPRASPEFVNRIVNEFEQTVRFYFVNSGMNVAIEPLFLEDHRPYTIAPGTHAGLGYAMEDQNEFETLTRLLTKTGLTAADFDGVAFVSCDKVWDEQRREYRYPKSGGWTSGPMPPFNIGKSGWKGGSDNSWLLCHEFHHQLDALYNDSGMPEFLFNHFQPWDGTAHRHGEHWDGNAWTLRHWAGHLSTAEQKQWQPGSLRHRYFCNLWGEVVQVRDRDDDGFPDRAPRLPLDEERFHSSHSLADTDSDGVSDLAEAMASEWVEFGMTERIAGDLPRHLLDPLSSDSDGDGMSDSIDPEPMYAFANRVSKIVTAGEEGHPFRWDGVPDESFWTHFGQFDDRGVKYDLSLAWDEEQLLLGFSGARAPTEIRVRFDASDDGWFVGADNYELHLHPEGGAASDGPHNRAATLSWVFHNCGKPGVWPFYDKARLAGQPLDVQQHRGEDGAWSAEIMIPRDAASGLGLKLGDTLGVQLAFRLGRPGENAQRPWITPFEPHRFFSVSLGR